MSGLSDLCTIVWPVLRKADGTLDSSTTEGDSWIVGWNPHSLSVIVTGFMKKMSLREATEKLQSIKKTLEDYETPEGMPQYKNLQILGYVGSSAANNRGRNNTTCGGTATVGSPLVFNTLPNPHENNMRLMQQHCDLWLELLEGPILGEVWCCGYRVQPCQLHVIRCDSFKQYSLKPTVFSACALYGPAGVRLLLNGQKPVCLPGMQCNMEGVLLPEVMMAESAPRVAPTVESRIRSHVMDSMSNWYNFAFAPTPLDDRSLCSLSGRDHWTPHAGPETLNGYSQGLEFNNSDGDHRHMSDTPEAALRLSGPHSAQIDNTKGSDLSLSMRSMAEPPAGIPPRLDFPISVDFSEIAVTLTMCCLGGNVQRVLLGLRPVCMIGEQRNTLGIGPHECNSSLVVENTKLPYISKFFDVIEKIGLQEILASPTKVEDFPQTGNDETHQQTVSNNYTVALWPYIHHLLAFLMYGTLILLRGLKPFSRFSWFAEVLGLRLREFVNFIALLDGKTISCGLHPVLPHQVARNTNQQHFCYLNYIGRNMTDLVLGVFITFLVIHASSTQLVTQHISRYSLFSLHMSYMDWFEGWPAGLKMNEDLNASLGFFGKMVLTTWDYFLSFTFLGGPQTEDDNIYIWITYVYNLMFYVSLMGASTSLAILADVIGLVTLHLHFLYYAMASLYRLAKELFVSLFNQFRGKKYNKLRNRTDAYEFSVEQMLIATFLLTITFFLFPTVAVYYFYFAFVRTFIWVVQECLVVLSHLLLYTPFFQITHWARFRHQYIGGMVLSDPIVTMTLNNSTSPKTGVSKLNSNVNNSNFSSMHHEKPSTTVELSIESISLPLSSILADFLVVLSVLSRLFMPTRVLSLIIKGEVYGWLESPIHDLIPHLLENCVDPRCTLLRGDKKGGQV